jgi:hypothetical protein
MSKLVVGQLAGNQCNAFYQFMTKIQVMTGFTDALPG